MKEGRKKYKESLFIVSTQNSVGEHPAQNSLTQGFNLGSQTSSMLTDLAEGIWLQNKESYF